MNWVLSIQAAILYTRLKGVETPFQKYWRWFFLAYAISPIFGGFSHLLFNYVDLYGKIPGWSIAIVGIVFAELAMINEIDDPKKKQMLITVVRSKVFATVVMLVLDLSFKWVMVHSAGFLVITGVLSYSRYKAGELNYKYFLYGIATLLVTGLIKVGKIDIHPAWFNRDDIAHFIMLFMYWMFYKGVKNFDMQRAVTPNVT